MMTWSGTRRRGCGAVLDGMQRRQGGDGGATTCTKYPGGRFPSGHPPQASVSFLEMEIICRKYCRRVKNAKRVLCARQAVPLPLYLGGGGFPGENGGGSAP